MQTEYDRNVYRGYLVQGNLRGAIEYLRQFPEKRELCDRYVSVFEEETYPEYEKDRYLSDLLLIYQKYYREVFYLGYEEERAAEYMRDRFAKVLGMKDESLDQIEERVSGIFSDRGFHFLGGKTSGYFGPYIWSFTETRTFEVELPGGVAEYTVNLLDGFISRSWLDFISFGETGTGGWTGSDGVINCVSKAYDLEGEGFRVSLLKHEAQHAVDLARCVDMPSEDLEYRAKLVELIYSRERNLLRYFLQEMSGSDSRNGHSLAAARIVEGISRKTGIGRKELENLSVAEVQRIAGELFAESEGVYAKL